VKDVDRRSKAPGQHPLGQGVEIDQIRAARQQENGVTSDQGELPTYGNARSDE
jgi:hypothetical protein